jgi:hypothetical protein
VRHRHSSPRTSLRHGQVCQSASVSLPMPRTLFAVLVVSALAGFCSTNSLAVVHGSQATRTTSPSVAPADVVRELFAAEEAHNVKAFCAMVTPAARVELRRSDRNPLHEIGGSCEQHLMNEFARGAGLPSDPIVGFGYTSLRTTSENADTAIVKVKDDKEGVTGTARSYTMELRRCGSVWLWNLWTSAMSANPVAKKLFGSVVRRYGCEPEAEVIKRRGLVIVNEESSGRSQGSMGSTGG